MADETSGSANPFIAFVHALRDLRVSPQVSLSIAVTSAVLYALTLLPASFVIGTALQVWRPWLALGFVGGLAFFAVGAFVDSWTSRRNSTQAARDRTQQAHVDATRYERALAQQIEFLSQLTVHEQQVLVPFIINGRRTNVLSLTDPDVCTLVNRGVLHLVGPGVSNAMGRNLGSIYSVADWAWHHLRSHPELLHLPAGAMEGVLARERRAPPPAPLPPAP
jgi:hypothetical protein